MAEFEDRFENTRGCEEDGGASNSVVWLMSGQPSAAKERGVCQAAVPGGVIGARGGGGFPHFDGEGNRQPLMTSAQLLCRAVAIVVFA